METPSFVEDHISQIPAIKLLMNLGWQYLTPSDALAARGGRSSNVLLETVLKEQLHKINAIQYKGKEFAFSDNNINAAILAIRDLPEQDGYIAANQHFYNLITLGRSFEQTVLGDKKSFSFRYIDWQTPQNNVFHVTEEFSVLRTGRSDHYRPDIVLFVNGIPMVVIECKSPREKDPAAKAVSQHIRNQQTDGIRALYVYSNLLLSLAVNEAKYATTDASKEYWCVWREIFANQSDETAYNQQLHDIKNKQLTFSEQMALFQERYKYVLQQFRQLEQQDQTVTEQDQLLYNLCSPQRLLDVVFNFTVYDNGVKKIARYQQYFAVKQTIDRVTTPNANGHRQGGVIWHTQGSGKSLTMVMLAQAIVMHPSIKNPKIVLVTDRIDLDDQITETFKKCGIEVKNATVGVSKEVTKKLKGETLSDNDLDKLKKDTSLVGLLLSEGTTVITTVINKFEAAVNWQFSIANSELFVLVDEGHRSQYGSFNVKMQQVFPQACFVAFTGTPLMRKEKSTAAKFGGIINVYSITNAVADKAVVPLLYEGRHNLIQVNEKPLDTYFDKIAEPLTEYGKAALKKKYSSLNQINKADQIIYARAWDISEYYEKNWKDTGFKAQLVAPNKLSAIKYKEYLDEIGKVVCDVIISAPDQREGEDDVYKKSDDKVKRFWDAMMDKYGNTANYEKTIINAFKKHEHPHILIVVDKLLTGFDAPRNTVLFLTRPLREHTLLQAVARVNRVFEGKDYGFIIDYFGNLQNLDLALNLYAGLEDFEGDDLIDTLTPIKNEIEKLPQAHSELWDIFKEIRNKYDEPAYENLLADEAIRHRFYDKLSAFSRLLKLALSSIDFCNNTPEKQLEKYKKDAKFFLHLRVSVKRRYFDDVDYQEYEPQIQKLIDKHITTEGEVIKITQLVDVFDKEQRQAAVDEIKGTAAKADHIASRTLKAINVKMNEDPVYYKKLATLIKETIAAYHQQRISEAEFLIRATEHESAFHTPQRNDIPATIAKNEMAISFYGQTNTILENNLKPHANAKDISAQIALGIDNCMRAIVFEGNQLIVDWQNNRDIEGKLKIGIDDVLYEINRTYELHIEWNQIDTLIEECLKIARVKYN